MIRGVLFDLDGTLLHSAPDLVGALNAVRARHGLPALSVQSMENHANAGALGLLQAGMPDADEETREGWRDLFLEHYEQNIFTDSCLYEGASELLEYLENRNIEWGIVTNKPGYLTHLVLAAAGIDRPVRALVCGDTITEKKPHPAPVRLACEQLGLIPHEVMFVGDDPRDLEAGKRAGVFNCAAMFGYGSPALRQPKNVHLYTPGIAVDSLKDLLDWFRSEA